MPADRTSVSTGKLCALCEGGHRPHDMAPWSEEQRLDQELVVQPRRPIT